jgi:hypothetical protein
VIGKTTVGAQRDANLRPRLADLGDDARHLLDLASANVGTALPRERQVAAAEHVERQIAVAIVVTVKEAAFLLAVQRDVGVVEIEHDLPWRALVRLGGTDRRTARLPATRRSRSCDTSRHSAAAYAPGD